MLPLMFLIEPFYLDYCLCICLEMNKSVKTSSFKRSENIQKKVV